LNKNDQILLDALQELQNATDSENVAEVIPISTKEWRELACKSLPQTTTKSKNDTFYRSLKTLKTCSKVVEDTNGYFRLLQDATTIKNTIIPIAL
jgi:tryptophan 2,3-dioxygenase